MTTANNVLPCPAEKGGSNWLPLLALLAVVIPLRGWLMWNTEVLARDSVIYIAYALQIEEYPWGKVLKANHHHPGYPLSIWAMSVPVRWLFGPADSFTMLLSTQLASNLAAVLLIFPLYFLGRCFFSRQVAFWGTLLFQCLPVSGQILSDGVSEPLYLLLTTTAFLSGVQALRRQSLLLFACCGVFCGLAYLTRPEGAVVLACTLLVLGAGTWTGSWRQSWRVSLFHGLALMLCGLAVGSVYFGFTGKFTNKPTAGILLRGKPVRSTSPETITTSADHGGPQNPASVTAEKDGPQFVLAGSFGSLFADTQDAKASLALRLCKGVLLFMAESLQTFHYLGVPFLLLGAVWHFRRLRTMTGFALPCVFVLIHGAVAVNMACGEVGYLSSRHLLPLAVWGVFFMAAGLCELPECVAHVRASGWFAGWFSRPPSSATDVPRSGVVLALLRPRLSVLVPLALVALCLPRTMQRIHASQASNHEAGLWLATKYQKGDFIYDNHNWALFYSGAMFRNAPEPPPGHRRRCYIVITRTRDAKRQEKLRAEEQELRSVNAQVVYRWPQQSTDDTARVLIYSVYHRDGWLFRWWNTPGAGETFHANLD